MKSINQFLVAAAVVMAAVSARASLDIPDGSTVGVVSTPGDGTGTLTTMGSGPLIGSVTLTLNITGGVNGDLYAYLSYNGGTPVILLNQPGTSSSNPLGDLNAGYNNVTLVASGGSGDFSATGSTSSTAQVATGTYNLSGLSSYDGLTTGGTWTLFIADLSGGDLGSSTLANWGLTLTAVPEPVNAALGIFGGLFAMGWWLRQRRAHAVTAGK